MCERSTGLARSIRQMDTPLNQGFFSDSNIRMLQRGIRQDFKNRTGISIDNQSRDDLVAIMRAEFVNSSGDHHGQVENQIRAMNANVLNTAVRQISIGVNQFINYMKDTENTATPLDLPRSTTTYGNKLEDQNFGI